MGQFLLHSFSMTWPEMQWHRASLESIQFWAQQSFTIQPKEGPLRRLRVFKTCNML